jgi:hypothetical protein
MSFGFFQLFNKDSPKSIEEGHRLIIKIVNDLEKDYQLKSYRLIDLIYNRKAAFMQQIYLLEDDEKSQQLFIEAYVHFAQILQYYIDHPDNINSRISQYHDSKAYCHVGGYDNELSYTFYDKAANYTLKFGLLLLVVGLVATPFNLPFGLIVIGISLTLMAPSLFYYLAITRQNELEVKKEETELFMEAQRVVDPEAVVELTEEQIYENNSSSLIII